MSSLARSALALVTCSHVLREQREGGKVLRAVPAADWEHRVTLRAGVHLLFSDWVGGVRDVVLVVDLQHLHRGLYHLVP